MKYIDADKLKEVIKDEIVRNKARFLNIINSLQQEQQEKKEVEFVFPKFLYARTTNNKTIDISYAPQSLDAIEYIRSDSIQQEQSEVYLEREISSYFKGWTETDEGIACHYQYVNLNTCHAIARHFYELGLNARKEK